MTTPDTAPDHAAILRGLQHFMPVAFAGATLSKQQKLGLVLVDPVVGFTRQGFLSDAVSMAPMVAAIDALCRDLLARLGDSVALYVFRDHHGPDQIEPPYPPHCQEGTGEELLDPDLRWLEAEPRATIRPKDCINGMIGALQPVESAQTQPTAYTNHFAEWVKTQDVHALMVVGDCTDICDLDFVVSALSARNHGMFGESRAAMPIMVYEPACATYHLPDPEALGLPITARHDRPLSHHAALYFMQARGAQIVSNYTVR
jgi:nicotinamidase-related amidase